MSKGTCLYLALLVCGFFGSVLWLSEEISGVEAVVDALGRSKAEAVFLDDIEASARSYTLHWRNENAGKECPPALQNMVMSLRLYDDWRARNKQGR